MSDLRRALLQAAAVGLAVRLVFALGYWTDKPLTRDEAEYLSLARSLAAGRGFVYDDVIRQGPVDPFGRAPGYPLFLVLAGGARDVVQTTPTAVKIVQSCLGAFGVVMVGLIAARLAGVRAGRLASAIAALYPPLVWLPAYALSEAVVWPLGLAGVWLFDRAMDEPSPRSWRLALICGLLTGASILIRPATIFFPILAGLWLLWKQRPAVLTALTIGTLLVVLPWTIRNASHYGRFVLVATEGGVTFWTGNHPLARGEGDMAANPELKRASQALREQHRNVSEEAMEPIYYREALAWIRSHPLDWLALEARKVFYLVVPIGPSYTLHSTRYLVLSIASYVIVLPLAIIGVLRLRERRRRTPGLWLLAGAAVLVALVFFPQERFRTPVIDPVLIICAGAVAFDPRRERFERL